MSNEPTATDWGSYDNPPSPLGEWLAAQEQPSATCSCGQVLPDPHGCIAGMRAELHEAERAVEIARAERDRYREALQALLRARARRRGGAAVTFVWSVGTSTAAAPRCYGCGVRAVTLYGRVGRGYMLCPVCDRYWWEAHRATGEAAE